MPRHRSRLLDPRHAVDLLVASDATLDRLRTGLRAVLGAGLAALALGWLGERAGAPSTVWLPGVNLAMGSALFLGDGSPGLLRRRLVAVVGAGFAAAALAVLGAGLPPFAAPLALAVIFAAVWARRFAGVGFGAGIALFLTFFVVQYFQLRAPALGQVSGALLLGGAVAALVRFVLVPDRLDRAAPRGLRGLLSAAGAALRVAEDGAARSGGRTPAMLATAHERLHAAALRADDLLVRVAGERWPTGTRIGALRERAFALELAAERAVQAVGQIVETGALPAGGRGAAAAALAAAGAALRGRPRAPEALAAALDRCAAEARAAARPVQAARDAWRLRSSLEDVIRTAGELAPDAAARRSAPVTPLAPAPLPAARGLPPHLRQALQATLAGGLAMLAGRQLSGVRWFWAVIAAFVVFNRATTVADTARRAWLRVLGTVLGAGFGYLLATAAAGHRALELTAVFGCVFLAYWMFAVSYAWLLFWFTALIAVLYRLLGQLTPQLLELRIAETLIGALLGATVAAVVLPIQGRARAREAAAGLLVEVARYLERAVVDRALRDVDLPLRATRDMDEGLRAVRELAQPLVGGAVQSPHTARLLHAVSAVVLHARHLAPGAALRLLEPPGRAEVAEAGRALAAELRAAAGTLRREGPRAGGAEDGDGPGRPADRAPRVERAAGAVERARMGLAGDAAVRRGPATPPVWLDRLEGLAAAVGELGRIVEPPAARRRGRARNIALDARRAPAR